MPNILSLRNYCIGFANRRILIDLDLDIEDKGVTHVLGPCGAGKSTLFRSLAGLNDRSCHFHCSGSATYLGEKLGLRERPALLEQKPGSLILNVAESIINSIPDRANLNQQQQQAVVLRLFDLYDCNHLIENLSTPLTHLPLIDRRIVLILGLVSAAPALLLLDEPTADIPKDEAKTVLRLIQMIAEQRAVMLVQHNQKLAKELNGNAILLAGGRIQEDGITTDLLTEPKSAAGKEFVATGTCAAPDPDSDPETLDKVYIDRYQPKVRKKPKSPQKTPFGPRGFRWVTKHSLAATPRPGLLADLTFDLQALAKVGVNHLISLEENETVSRMLASEHGIEVHHFPIPDMQAPGLAETDALTLHIDEEIRAGNCLAVHCKAGLGRTGTIIASYFVKSGMNPLEAMRKIRCIDPRMIQSQQQEDFIEEFHGWLQDHPLEYHESVT
jgi:atypical dual specificity phosphatase